MSFQSQVLADIAAHPGSSVSEVSKRFPEDSYRRAASAVYGLFRGKKITRVAEKGVYCYSVVEQKSYLEVNLSQTKILAVEDQVKQLINKGFYRRAGLLCLDLMFLAATDHQRQEYAALRANCLQNRGKRE